MTPASQICSKCGVEKDAGDYYQGRPGRLRRECKPCHLAGRAEWRKANRPKLNRLFFGISDERYAAMLAEQGGACAICRKVETSISARTGKVTPLQVDHDHRCCSERKRCGECVRGLLCGKCNRALGLFQDDPNLLLVAAEYLRANSRTP